MITRQAMAAVALLIAAASAAAQPAPAPKPETPTTTPAAPPKPVAKPTAAPAQPALPAAPVQAQSARPAVSAASAEKVALSVPLPRAKPKPPAPWPPSPRLKPEPPVEVAGAAPTTALVALSATAPTAAVVPTGEEALAACGNACSEILFKTVDDCLWVQSQNPRPIAFEAQVGGRAMALKLEGANPEKADARVASTLKGASPQAEAAYHTRLHDPFQSVSAGIAAYRVRLGPASACVKSRSEIQRFTATFAP